MLKNKTLMLSIFVVFSCVLEIIMFCFIKTSIMPKYILLNLCSVVLLGIVITLIPSNKGSLIYLGSVLFIQMTLNIANYVMYDNCGDVFSFLYFKLIREAARVFEFSFFNIGKVLVFILLFVGYILVNLFLIKKNIIKEIETEKYFSFLKKQFVLFVVGIIAISTYVLQIAIIKSGDDEDVFSDNYLYTSLNLKAEGLKNFGTWGYYAKEFQKVFFTSNASKSTIDSVNKYLSEGDVLKTEYFGLLKDKNVVMVMMESVQWFAIDEYLTPNLYKLAGEGLSFSNYYSKNKTNISEMIGITGSYPVTNTLNVKNVDYNFVNSIINQLGEDYESTFVHPNTGDFYNREILMPQLGFDNDYFFYDLFPDEKLYDWGDFVLDSVSMEASLDYLVPRDSKFYSFFTTLSTHGPYDKSDKNVSLLQEKGYFELIDNAIKDNKWANPLKDTDRENVFRYYKAMAIDLDRAVGILIDDLKKKGVLDDTVLVLYGDHNAYYQDLCYLYYGVDGGSYYKPFIFKTPLIIYNKDLTNAYLTFNNLEGAGAHEITKFVSTYNIVPTLLDLLGIEYNYNMYLGTSVFMENNYDINNVFFSLQGGIFNDVIYTINGHDVIYTELNEYGEELNNFREASKLFLNKLKYIEYIYVYNLFDKVNIDVNVK